MIRLGDLKQMIDSPVCKDCGGQTDDDAAINEHFSVYCYGCAKKRNESTWKDLEEALKFLPRID